MYFTSEATHLNNSALKGERKAPKTDIKKTQDYPKPVKGREIGKYFCSSMQTTLLKFHFMAFYKNNYYFMG